VTGEAESNAKDLDCAPRFITWIPELHCTCRSVTSPTVMEYCSMDLLMTRSSVNTSARRSAQWSILNSGCCSHGLKLNADKSDDIWLCTRQQLVMINQADKDCDYLTFQAEFCGRQKLLVTSGVIIDQQITLDAHARACSSLFLAFSSHSTDQTVN